MRNASFGLGGALVLTLCVSPQALAAETQFTPVISISETYTDNVLLAPPGLEEYDWVTEASAGFNFSGTGRRARISLSYNPSVFTFARQNEVQLRQQLSSSGQMELVRDHLFLNGAASVSERFTGSDRDISVSDRNLSGDRVQVASYSLTPELRNRFASVATATLQYRFAGSHYGEPEDEGAQRISDSINHAVTLNVNSGEDFQRFRWGLTGRWSKQDRDAQAVDVEDKEARANVSYNVNRTVAFTGALGYSDFGTGSLDDSDRSSMTWEVGVRLTPSRRTSLNVAYGKDRNNNRWSVDGSYEPDQRTSIRVSYNESYRTSQEQDIGGLPSLDDEPAVPAAPGLGGAFDFFDRNDIPGGSLTNEVFLDKQFTIAISRTFSRTSVTITGQDSDRSYDGGTGEEYSSVTGIVSHTFSSNVSGNIRGSYIRREESSGRDDDIYTASATLRRTLLGNASVFVSYDYTRRDSNFFLFNLRENAVTAGLSASF